MRSYLDNLDEVKELLLQGMVILCPTDTIWGLSCDALNPKAVEQVFSIKNRDPSKTLILLVDSVSHLKKYIQAIHPRIETLIHYHRRPVSIIYKANEVLPKYLVTPENTVAIRVVKLPMLQELIAELGRPLVSTSANVQGAPSPSHFRDISPQILDKVDYTFMTGRDSNNSARSSMLIRFDEEGELIFIRE